MKITDVAIVFVIITLPFVQILRIKSDNLHSIEYKSVVLNKYLDAAVEDAANAMIVRGKNPIIDISRDNAIDAFFKTLFTNFNILDNDTAISTVMVYIPVIVIIDYDGYWVYSMEEYKNSDGQREQKMVFKSKKPYACERDGYIYLFTLDDYIRVYDSVNDMFYEGYREGLKSCLNESYIQEADLFEQVRKRTIIEWIKNDVNIAINEHNRYAKLSGITYRFSPPSISDGDWQRNIEDMGVLAFIQGIPIGLGGERFNSFALGAARIVRKDLYYIHKGLNDIYYYHREHCPELTQKDKVYDTREECALKGAFPCRTCKP